MTYKSLLFWIHIYVIIDDNLILEAVLKVLYYKDYNCKGKG